MDEIEDIFFDDYDADEELEEMEDILEGYSNLEAYDSLEDLKYDIEMNYL